MQDKSYTPFVWFEIVMLTVLAGCGKDSEIQKGQQLAAAGDYEAAIKHFVLAVENNPENADAHYHLGLVYSQISKHPQAISELQAALQLEPNAEEIKLALGKAYLALGQQQDAFKLFIALLQASENNPLTPFIKGDKAVVQEIAELTGEVFHVTQLTPNETDSYDAVFSPDGKQIAFVSFPEGNAEIYLLDTQAPLGKKPNQLTYTSLQDEISPAFSPDGEWLVFEVAKNVSSLAGLLLQASGSTFSDAELWMINLKTRERKPVGGKLIQGRNPAFSPDGNQIVFSANTGGNWEILGMDIRRGNPQSRTTALSGETKQLTFSDADESEPAFSPDGKRIAFVSTRDGNPEIYLMDKDGKNPLRLTQNTIGDYAPCFSRDGRQIIFVSSEGDDIELFVIDAEGKHRRQLTRNRGVSLQPTLSPDGKQLAFVSDRGAYLALYLMDFSKPVTRHQLIACLKAQL